MYVLYNIDLRSIGPRSGLKLRRIRTFIGMYGPITIEQFEAAVDLLLDMKLIDTGRFDGEPTGEINKRGRAWLIANYCSINDEAALPSLDDATWVMRSPEELRITSDEFGQGYIS